MSIRISLIHATPLSIPPTADAFTRHWPDAELVNLLDDALSRDRARDGELTDAMIERFVILGDYAAGIGSQGILFTCSAFAKAIETVQTRLTIPVLKPNEAMLEAALARNKRLGLIASFPATIDSMTAELEQLAAARGVALALHTGLARDAMEQLAAGNREQHDRSIAATALDLPEVDAILLAQFSMARARPAVEAALPAVPVLTAPDSAVQKLYRLLHGTQCH